MNHLNQSQCHPVLLINQNNNRVEVSNQVLQHFPFDHECFLPHSERLPHHIVLFLVYPDNEQDHRKLIYIANPIKNGKEIKKIFVRMFLF